MCLVVCPAVSGSTLGGTPILRRSCRIASLASPPVPSTPAPTHTLAPPTSLLAPPASPLASPPASSGSGPSHRRGRQRSTRNRDILRRVHEMFIQERLEREARETTALTAHITANLEGAHLDDPLSYEAAMACTYSKQWRAAMAEEMDSLLLNNTWEAVDGVSASACAGRAIGSKWVFKVKHNPDGTVRFKARLVIKGYEQRKGKDFDQTYAPVSHLSSFRLLLGLASARKWQIDQLDVVTAFLNPVIDKENVYMTLPLGIGDLPPHLSGQLVRLRKALYGLRQAPRLWYLMIDKFLMSIGFRKSNIEPNLYIQDDILLLLYVDDMLIAYQDSGKAQGVKDSLQAEYRMQDVGPARRFLGLDIEREADGTYSVHQRRYIDGILRRFGMESANTAPTPLHKNTMLDYFKDDQPVDQGEYLCLVGSLMYAALGTRPDISFAVGALSAYNHDPWKVHLTAAKRVLRYLKGTRDLGIHFSRVSEEDGGSVRLLGYSDAGWENSTKTPSESVSLLGYSDADWANNVKDRHSVGAFIFFYGGPVSWQSRKQTILATSTLESEFSALFESGKEALWLRQLLHDITGIRSPLADHLSEIALLYIETLQDHTPEEIGRHLQLDKPQPSVVYGKTLPEPTVVYTDSQCAIENVRTEGISARNKHFDICLFKSRELQQAGVVDFVFRGTDENAADGLTKALAQPRHEVFLKQLGLVAC